MPLIKYHGPTVDGFVNDMICDVKRIVTDVDKWNLVRIETRSGLIITRPRTEHFGPAYVRCVKNGEIYPVIDRHSETDDVRITPDGYFYDRSRFEPAWNGKKAAQPAAPDRWRLEISGVTLQSEIFEQKPEIIVDPSGALIVTVGNTTSIIASGNWKHVNLEKLVSENQDRAAESKPRLARSEPGAPIR